MEFRDLIERFAEKVGGGDPAFDGEDICHLTIAERDVGFMSVPQLDRLLAWTVVGQKPETGVEPFYEQLLKANFMGRALPSGAFSLSDDGFVYAHCTFAESATGSDELAVGVDRFLTAVADWADLTRDYAGLKAAEQARRQDDHVSETEFIRAGFLQV